MFYPRDNGRRRDRKEESLAKLSDMQVWVKLAVVYRRKACLCEGIVCLACLSCIIYVLPHGSLIPSTVLLLKQQFDIEYV